MASPEQPKSGNARSLTLVVTLVCVMIWIANYAVFRIPAPHMFSGTANFTQAGQIGDAFGASNALFSALTLIVVAYAALTQREELKVAREELARTKEIFEKQNSQLDQENILGARRDTRQAFFTLLSLFNEAAQSFDVSTTLGGNKVGRYNFCAFTGQLQSVFESQAASSDNAREFKANFNSDQHRTLVEEVWSYMRAPTGRYLNSLIFLLEFVAMQPDKDQAWLLGVTQTTISQDEAIVLWNLICGGVLTERERSLLARLDILSLHDQQYFRYSQFLPRFEG
jgi:hypothetical protein